jgi:hypothetical protein
MKEMRNAHKFLVEVPEGNRPFQRPVYKLEDEVKIGVLR